MPSWPVTLPQDFLRDGFQRTPQSNVISFGTEVGGGKVRRRSTARTKVHTGTLQLTKAQVALFEEFFENDLKDGALSFDWTDPVTDDFVAWRFDPDNVYTLREIAKDIWSLSISLIRLP